MDRRFKSELYIADRDAIDDRLKPYSWYKDFGIQRRPRARTAT